MASTLLGYPLRRAAAMEMLYGGIRVQHLAQSPFPLHRTRSEDLPPPSLRTERGDLDLEVHDSAGNTLGLRLSPCNVGMRARSAAVRLRSEDCHRRLLAQRQCAAAGEPLRFPPKAPGGTRGGVRGQESGRCFHPPPAQLSIFTRPVDWEVSAGTTRTVASRAWKPLQVLKPMPHNWSPTLRSSGVRGPHMQLMQERIDGKGFGWKRKSRSLWQQDIDTAGFRPKRFF